MNIRQTAEREPHLVLAGNPNVGKSVVFQALTGVYAEVSNYPGTTVDVTTGTFGPWSVTDTPGVFSLSGYNDEEQVTLHAVSDCDCILNVMDATHMARDLFLTLQLLALGKPILLAVNLIDQAEKSRIRIDIKGLSKALGVDILPVSAKKGTGIKGLKEAVLAAPGSSGPSFRRPRRNWEAGLRQAEGSGTGTGSGSGIGADMGSGIGVGIGMGSGIGTGTDAGIGTDMGSGFGIGSNIGADMGSGMGSGVGTDSGIGSGVGSGTGIGAAEEEDYIRIRRIADDLAARFVRETGGRTIFSQRLGRAILNPIVGIPFLVGMLSLIFLFIGKFLSQTVIDFTEGYLMEECYFHFIYGLVSGFVNPDSFTGTLLIGEYGLLTMVPIYLFGLLLPLIIGFYFSLALLEDSGLLPRIAVLCDRLFTRFGLNGKAVIPVLLGFGCVTMALITTRILGTKRERLIATVLLCIAVPCSAQFSIILVVASVLPPFYFLIYGGSILLLFFLLGALLDRFLPGVSSDLFLVLPPLRLPGLKNVMQKTAMKSKHFLQDAGPMFLIGSLMISILSYTNGFLAIHQFLLPLTEGLLGLPAETATLFLMSIIKRDLGAAYLYSMVSQGLLSFPQMTVALTVVTLFVPCFASVAILFKERGPLAALSIWLVSFAAAFLMGGAMAAFLIR